MRHSPQPMNVCSLAVLTCKTAFLLTLAAAKCNSEVWAFSADVVFGHDKQSATLRFLPGFHCKTQKPDRPDSALSPVTIPALAPFTGPDLPKKALCPIRALRYSLSRTNFSEQIKKAFFVSIKPGRQKDIAKTTISGWIKGIIRSAYSEAKSEDIPHLPRKCAGQRIESDGNFSGLPPAPFTQTGHGSRLLASGFHFCSFLSKGSNPSSPT